MLLPRSFSSIWVLAIKFLPRSLASRRWVNCGNCNFGWLAAVLRKVRNLQVSFSVGTMFISLSVCSSIDSIQTPEHPCRTEHSVLRREWKDLRCFLPSSRCLLKISTFRLPPEYVRQKRSKSQFKPPSWHNDIVSQFQSALLKDQFHKIDILAKHFLHVLHFPN
jgi:hypothetical protein